MKYNLSDFKGHYHSMPNVVAHFLPSNEYMTLLQIYIASHKCLCNDTINVSLRNLAMATGIHRTTIVHCIENLQTLNLLRTSIASKKNTAFKINWQEIYTLEKVASTVTYEGLEEIKKICFAKSCLTAFSKIDSESISTIQKQYAYTSSGTKSDKNAEIVPDEESELRSSGTILDKIEKFVPDAIANGMTTGAILKEIVKMMPVGENEYPNTGTLLTKMLDFVPDNTENIQSGTNYGKNNDFVPDKPVLNEPTGTNHDKNAEIVPVTCNVASHFITKESDKFIMNVVLSNAERYLMEAVGVNAFDVRFSTGTKSALLNSTGTICDKKSADFVPDAPKTGTPTVPQIRYKENKENNGKRSFPIIGGETKTNEENENDDEPTFLIEESKNNFLDFIFSFSGKDIEFPVNDKNNLEDFSEQPQKEDETQTSSYYQNKTWEEFRDLSLPSYQDIEFESIVEDRDFNNTDEDRIIQRVWDYLSSSEIEESNDDVEEQDTQETVPVQEFYRNLFSIWSELKEQDKGFQLSEKDVRNIFGFDVVWNEEDKEWCFVISSNKIKKLSKDEPQSSRKRVSRNKGNRGMAGRASIRTFLDCLSEVGDKNFQLLTKVEKAIYVIDQYSKEGRVVCESGFVREPHETINGLLLPGKKKEWAKVSGMSIEDISELLDGYKHKGGIYTLHATKLSPDFIISFNEKYDEESEVERRWNEKMAG